MLPDPHPLIRTPSIANVKASAEAGTRTVVACSFMQIYNERIQDLLQPYKQQYTTRDPRDIQRTKANLDIREDPERGTYVQDLTLLKVRGGGWGCSFMSRVFFVMNAPLIALSLCG